MTNTEGWRPDNAETTRVLIRHSAAELMKILAELDGVRRLIATSNHVAGRGYVGVHSEDLSASLALAESATRASLSHIMRWLELQVVGLRDPRLVDDAVDDELERLEAELDES